jgi:hypothetical protein
VAAEPDYMGRAPVSKRTKRRKPCLQDRRKN